MKKSLIAVLVLITLCALALAACVPTVASWTNQNTDTGTIDANVTKVNGSEKYIVYAALKTVNNQYVLKGSADSGVATTAYAVVGYTGLVAELVIPAQYAGQPIVQVLTLSSREDDNGISRYGSDYMLYSNNASYTGQYAALRNNDVVTSIVFGTNVAFIEGGACAGMTKLTSVTFTFVESNVSSDVSLGNAAFGACAALTSVTGTWTPSSEGATPFIASGYTPPAP